MPKRRKNFSQPGRNREIPGFYYDHDKKRYFKIAPNHASGSCVYTKDSIDQRHAEEKRIEDATDMCSVGKHVILYTAINNLFEGESIAFMRGLHDETKHLDQEYLLGSKVAWSCAWNPVRHQMAIGCEKSAQIINAERRTMFELNTNKCDPLALTFSQRGGCLYAGVRKGEVQVFDAQRGRPNPVYRLPHASGVVSVKPVHNDLHLLTGDFSGKIQLWDTRQRGVVVEYEGHVNKCTRLPIHIDETENIVYAVGEDGYTRFWDFREGRLLYTLPPPGPVTRETMPCVQLSTHWANQPGNCGLIMARENKLHYYGRLPATHLL
ncbi:DCAF4-like protein [Mya arenaria]|uniref:DCAF4-like protein n=1 Tax=Mya arenaria TaxID=6604 RepID=A0ABY7FDG7_MYAAR|nr:DCAF4-like protein [Mya arenaria]